MTQSAFQLKEHSSIAPGLWAIHFDLPGEKVNKLGPSVMKELDVLLTTVQKKTDIKALVFLSEKTGIFIAGADIEVIKSLKTPAEAEAMAREGQAVLERIENFSFPTIAAINGAAMGGGLEFALCCKYIVVSDSPSTRIALPEVNLGVLPGFGGTVRLPKRIGLQSAMDMILTGKNLTGERAMKAGLADGLLPNQNFNTRVLEWAGRLLKGEKVSQRKRNKTLMNSALEDNFLGRSVLFSQAKKQVLAKTRGHYPAALKILDTLSKNYGVSKKKALEIEQKAFGELCVTDVSKRLIELFFLTEKVKKQTGVTGKKIEKADQVKHIGLLGAGVMGGGIAQVCVAKNIPVRMKDIDYKGLGIGIASANKVFSDAIKRKRMTKREADIKLALISPTTDYTGFQQCDYIIEAVVENMDIKKKVLQETEAVSSGVFATNTSSLSVTELATASKNPENVVGMHFFNPVHRMPLVEVIRGEKTSDRAILVTFDLAKRLGKTPIVVKDGGGFLVNRLLMPYLNEGMFIMSEGANIEELDELVLDFGMPMGPATLLDEIGLDVAEKVGKILNKAFGDRMKPCSVGEKLSQAKLLGKKSAKGFYVYDAKGKKQSLNPDIYNVLGVSAKALGSQANKQQLVERMIYIMINEAALCLKEGIVEDPSEVDLGMIMGTGFPPFRGGLLRYADSVGVANIVKKLEELSKSVGKRFEPSDALRSIASGSNAFYK